MRFPIVYAKCLESTKNARRGIASDAVILKVMSTVQATTPGQTLRERTSYAVLVMISFCHFLNDMIQSLLPAIYPILFSCPQYL